jgi:glycosyltransferase involved in cell wall biosynthesis
MNMALVHNRYAADSGEETVVENIADLLAAHGHRVTLFMRSSAEIRSMVLGRTRALFSGIFNFSAMKAFRPFLSESKPDIVHIHNLFPLISPSVLIECRRAHIPVVMHVHNYRLVCPNGLHMPKTDLRICEKCCGGREYWCVLRNCEGNLPKSLGYALRSYVARKAQLYRANVSVYICLTCFQKQRLVSQGYPEDRTIVLPNMVRVRDEPDRSSPGNYVGFVGRVSPEKGISVFLKAAKKCPHIEFSVAGSYDRMPDVLKQAPDNCRFLGHLRYRELSQFYNLSRIVVAPSLWYETFCLTAMEAQAYGKPVICSHIGALSEVVDCGVTGLLFRLGDADELAEKIQYLWDRPDLCRRMGAAGRDKFRRNYSAQQYYERLMAVYGKAIKLGPPISRGKHVV